MMNDNQQQIESDAAARESGTTTVALWLKKIKAAQDEEKDWRAEALEAEQVYEAEEVSGDAGKSRLGTAANLFHSNIETMCPAVYNSEPIPDVRRRYGDKDKTAKQVSDITERALSYSVDQYPFGPMMRAAVHSAAVTGRGLARLRYRPEFGAETMGADGQPFRPVVDQRVAMEFVPWDRYIRGPGRLWSEVPWIAFPHDLTKDALRELGARPELIEKLTPTDSPETDRRDEHEPNPHAGIYKTLKVYEIWDRDAREVLFISPQEKDEPLVQMDDPLGLPEFFPTPRPIEPIRRLRSLVPIVPRTIYKRLLSEFDRVTRRIDALTKQLKVRGLYDSKLKVDFEQMLIAQDGQYIGADATEVFASGSAGGLEKHLAHWPLEPIVRTLQQLYLQRDQVKQLIYEITGLSDIMRGASNANETLGAQQIKAQWGSLRIQQFQAEVARFVVDIFRMKAAIFAGKFQSDVLSRMTGVEVTPEVEQLLRDEVASSYRIDIETDSTIRADMTRSQEQMNIFIAGTGQYMTAVSGMVEVLGPTALPALAQIYVAFTRKFELGKQAEDALESMVDLAEKGAQQPKPNPEAQKAQAEAEALKLGHQTKMQEHAAKAGMDQRKGSLEIALQEKDLALKTSQLAHQERLAAMEIEAKALELQAMRERAEIDANARREEIALKREVASIDVGAKRETTALQRDLMVQEANGKAASREAEAKADASVKAKPEKPDKPDPAIEKRLADVERRKRISFERGADGKITGAKVD